MQSESVVSEWIWEQEMVFAETVSLPTLVSVQIVFMSFDYNTSNSNNYACDVMGRVWVLIHSCLVFLSSFPEACTRCMMRQNDSKERDTKLLFVASAQNLKLFPKLLASVHILESYGILGFDSHSTQLQCSRITQWECSVTISCVPWLPLSHLHSWWLPVLCRREW